VNPLSGLYGSVAGLRNALFDRGVLSSRRLTQPVISVGNLTAGGAGKTPFVIALGQLLKSRGIPFDVLSRGYGRKTRRVLVVEVEGKAADFGDEPLLIARRLGVPVVVGESRYAAGLVAERKFDSQLHILDDGFQHRALVRDFDIVLMTEHDFADTLLPLGRLREPLLSLARADAIVLPAGLQIDHRAFSQKPIWRVERKLVVADAPSAPIVFCGIARPEQFFLQVRGVGIEPVAEIEFRDHHAYDGNDVERLLAMSRKLGASGFLTTEKDSINLESSSLQSELRPLAVAMLSVVLDHPADMVDTILTTIAERRARS
jgi:tetraacyldisaccharide 4'-kinase